MAQQVAAVLFLLSAAFAVYVLFLYPVLVRILARRRGQPVKKAPTRKTVSVIIVVRNGEAFLEAKLRSVLALRYPRELMEILVVSDGSEDRTDEIARSFADQGVELLRIPRGGKCAGLNAGIPRTSHEILMLTDVRQTLDPDSLQQLINCYADPAVGVASGTLHIREGESQAEVDVGLYREFENWLRNQLSQVDSIFGATGSFYTMRRELAFPLAPEALLDDVCLPLGAFFQGYRLIIDPAAKAYDFPTSLHTEFRRKVRTLAGNYQLFEYYPQLLTSANRMRWHFLSYKLGRLLLPFALLIMLITSPLLPSPWNWPVTGAQAVFYGLGLVDSIVPQGFLLKRLSSPIHSFLVMMGASACAIAILFVPPQTLWKETQVQKTKSA